MPPRRRTATSNFGVGRRESHMADAFYARFEAPELSAGEHVNPHEPGVSSLCGDARRMQALADRLEELAAQPRSGLTGLVGRSRLEDVVSACLEELHAQGLKIQAVRRSLVASDRGRR